MALLGLTTGSAAELSFEDIKRTPVSELDWDTLYLCFVELRKATPFPRPFALCSNREKLEVSMVSYRGVSFPRRRAHELLLKLDHHIALLFGNHLAYLTQLTVELILAAEALKHEHEQEIFTMLRDVGQAGLTVESIFALCHRRDPARVRLEAALMQWTAKQAEMKWSYDRVRKRADSRRTRRRREARNLKQQHEPHLSKLLESVCCCIDQCCTVNRTERPTNQYTSPKRTRMMRHAPA